MLPYTGTRRPRGSCRVLLVILEFYFDHFSEVVSVIFVLVVVEKPPELKRFGAFSFPPPPLKRTGARSSALAFRSLFVSRWFGCCSVLLFLLGRRAA